MLADLKNTDHKVAAQESLLYAINGVSVQKEKVFYLQVGIPATRERMDLVVYMPRSGTMWWLPVVRNSKPWDKALLCTIYVAVHYLIDHPIKQDSAFTPQPKKNATWLPVENSLRVYTDANKTKVYKLFESEIPNEDLLVELSIPYVLYNLSNDGLYHTLELNFIKGTTTTTRLKQLWRCTETIK